MKLLCIGKSGQIARALAERSALSGTDCVCLGRPELDLLQANTIAAALDRVQPAIVVNAAAFTAVDAAETQREAAFALNSAAVGGLSRLCAQRGIPLIHLSTDYVFDGSGEDAWRESDETKPLNAYGASKLAGEQALREALDQHIILRTAWVYSPFGNNFVKTMLKLADTQGGASVVDDQIGSPTNAFDIADTILQIAARVAAQPDPSVYGTYHYCAAGYASWADVAALIFDTYDSRHGCKIELKRIPSSDYPTPAKRPRNSRLDTDKITETFGIVPQDWRPAVTATVERLMDERATSQ
jgi:dTDP-4-dehydrorhamnose reductase